MVEVVKFGAVNRKATCKSRIWNLPIAARAGFPNAEPQSCRENFRQSLLTTLKPDFLGTAVERVVLNALRKRLRRLIFCACGDPLCIVFGEADPPFRSIRLGSCCVRGAGNPTTIAPTARPHGSQSRGYKYSPVINHFSVRIKASAGAWDELSASVQLLASVSVWEWQ